jgi:hypothetical protein
MSTKKAEFLETATGAFYANSAGVARLAYEAELADIMPESRAHILAFQARVNAYMDAQALATGSRPTVEDALAALIDYRRMDGLFRRGDIDGALSVIFSGASG